MDNDFSKINQEILEGYCNDEKKYLESADPEKYGQMIRLLRTEQGHEKTLQSLADSVGTTKQALSAIENGKRKKISAKLFEKLTELFRCSPDYLLGYTQERLESCSKMEQYLIEHGRKRDLPIPEDIVKQFPESCKRLIMPFTVNESDEIERGKKQLERIDKELLDLLLVCSKLSESKRRLIKNILKESIELASRKFR